MTTEPEKPRVVQLVGSVPLGKADEVLRMVGSILGRRLPRVPDGDTGVRASWIAWQRPVMMRNPRLESALG